MTPTTSADALDPRTIAKEVADALEACRQIPTFSGRDPALTVAKAQEAALQLRRMRGGSVVGRKIGFTNRNIWSRYNVDAPMWGDMTDRTVHAIEDGAAEVALSPYSEPKLEPEIALKLAAVPASAADDDALLSCVEWFAPAFEVVHSVFPGWRFTLADSVATGGLHGALYLGAPVAAGDWARALPGTQVILSRDGTEVERGRGENALGGPLTALRHLVEGLEAIGDPLSPGDIITTGTLTDAQSLSPGETWAARFDDAPFEPIAARFV